MHKEPLSRQAKAKLDVEIRHRINAGRAAIKKEIHFFERHFSEVGSDWKRDRSRVTFADIAISENLTEQLKRTFQRDDFCSEEMSDDESVQFLKNDFAWVLDPIDGTNNFALGFPLCAISLALLYQGMPMYGFVYDYSTKSLIEGGKDYGLRINEKVFTPLKNTREEQFMIGMQFPIANNTLTTLSPLLEKYKVRSIGSSTMLGALVSKGYLWGAVDMRCKVWDFAASVSLCEATNRATYFIEDNPFPLTEFHPNLPKFPYFSGEDDFCKTIKRLLRIE